MGRVLKFSETLRRENNHGSRSIHADSSASHRLAQTRSWGSKKHYNLLPGMRKGASVTGNGAVKKGDFVDLRLACDLEGGKFELKKASAQ